MIARTTVLCALLAGVLVQYALPDTPLYQFGWYNVALAALLVIALLQSRFTKTHPAKNIWSSGIALLRMGLVLFALAGIANGLLAPTARTFVGAPGTTVPVPDLQGSLQFSADVANPTVGFTNGERSVALCGRPHIVSAFEVWCFSREVVSIQAFDAIGAHLTITQPNGTAFLSPILLLEQKQKIAGIELPYDSFALPAAHRLVNAVYFDVRHAAALRGITTGEPAVLLAVDDETNQPLPHAIALARSHQRLALGGVEIIPTVLFYPAIRVAPVPPLVLVILGLLGIGAGLYLHIRERRMLASGLALDG